MNAVAQGEPWDELAEATRLRLLEEYGHWLDTLPPTCSPEEKNARFAAWLAARGVAWTPPAGRPGKAEGR